MKNIYKLLFIALILFFVGCEDPDKGPIFLYQDLQIGAYPRLVSNEDGEGLIPIATEDVLNAFSHTYQVEFVNEDKGASVASYKVDIEYVSAEKVIKEKADFITLVAEKFVTSDKGFKQIPETNFTSQQLLTALGLTFGDLKTRDRINFIGEMTMQDGRKYSSENSSPTVVGTFFQGYFDFTLHIGCATSLDKTTHVKTSDGKDIKGGYIATTNVTLCKGAAPSTVTTVIDTVIVSRNSTIAVGEYSFDDWTFGVNKSCFGKETKPQTGFIFEDECGEVKFTSSSDEFGNSWNYSSTVSEKDWTITWNNGADQDFLAKISGVTVIKFPDDITFTVN